MVLCLGKTTFPLQQTQRVGTGDRFGAPLDLEFVKKEGQVAVQPFVQPFDEARTADHMRPRRRDIQFCGEHGCRHSAIIKTPVLRCQLRRFGSASCSVPP